jgi:hypothetical protein
MAIGTTTALIAGAVIGAGAGALAAKANKPNIPNPGTPDMKSQSEIDTSAKDRQDRARKNALAAYGRTDTLLTGSQGLGGTGTQPGAQQNFQNMGKSLLGQ